MTQRDDARPKRNLVSESDLGFKPIPVVLANGEMIEFRFLTGADEKFIVNLLKQEIHAREFVVEFLRHQLVRKEPPLSNVSNWSDDDLKLAARMFAVAPPSGFGEEIGTDVDVYEEFQALVRIYQQGLLDSARKLSDLFSANYAKQIKPIFGASNSLASFRSLSAFDPSKYRLGFPSPDALVASASRQALDGVLATVYPDSSRLPDATDQASAKLFTMPAIDMLERFSSSATVAIKAANDQLFDSIARLSPQIDVQTLIPQLPNFTESLRRLKKARDGALALEEAGFGYTYNLWGSEFLGDLSAIDPQDRSTGTLHEIRAFTEGQECADELQTLFAEPSLLAKRWPAVREAVEAHRHGKYFCSVAVLLSQVEGIINDILTLLDVAVQDKARFYVKDASGEPGKELKGLHDKNALARKRLDSNHDLAKYVATFLVPDRNSILHGVDVAYGQPERSVHLMLVLLSFSLTMHDCEAKITGSSQI